MTSKKVHELNEKSGTSQALLPAPPAAAGGVPSVQVGWIRGAAQNLISRVAPSAAEATVIFDVYQYS